MNLVRELLLRNKRAGRKQLAVLIDPDKTDQLQHLLELAAVHTPDLFLVGGSLMHEDRLHEVIALIKKACAVPVVLFPGSHWQIASEADALLLLSVISGRNPDLLIGRHVLAAPALRRSNLELLPTGYLLIDSGRATTVSYMSQTTPIPQDKPEIAAATALAGEQLGLQAIYLEAGSGAQSPVPERMIEQVRHAITGLLFVGGGIRHAHELKTRCAAGADIVVVGNVLETQPELLPEFVQAIHSFS